MLAGTDSFVLECRMRVPFDASTGSGACIGAAGAFPAALADLAFSDFVAVGTAPADGPEADAVGCMGAFSTCCGALDEAGCTEDVFGEFDALVLPGAGGSGDMPITPPDAPGGGGRGAMPTLCLSLAAAAAAADAYFNPSPAGLVGIEAGFIAALLCAPLLMIGNGVCNVASEGRGDLSCVEGLLPVGIGASVAGLAFPPGMLFDRASTSGVSSCTDCVSWEDTLSLS